MILIKKFICYIKSLKCCKYSPIKLLVPRSFIGLVSIELNYNFVKSCPN